MASSGPNSDGDEPGYVKFDPPLAKSTQTPPGAAQRPEEGRLHLFRFPKMPHHLMPESSDESEAHKDKFSQAFEDLKKITPDQGKPFEDYAIAVSALDKISQDCNAYGAATIRHKTDVRLGGIMLVAKLVQVPLRGRNGGVIKKCLIMKGQALSVLDTLFMVYPESAHDMEVLCKTEKFLAALVELFMIESTNKKANSILATLSEVSSAPLKISPLADFLYTIDEQTLCTLLGLFYASYRHNGNRADLPNDDIKLSNQQFLLDNDIIFYKITNFLTIEDNSTMPWSKFYLMLSSNAKKKVINERWDLPLIRALCYMLSGPKHDEVRLRIAEQVLAPSIDVIRYLDVCFHRNTYLEFFMEFCSTADGIYTLLSESELTEMVRINQRLEADKSVKIGCPMMYLPRRSKGFLTTFLDRLNADYKDTGFCSKSFYEALANYITPAQCHKIFLSERKYI